MTRKLTRRLIIFSSFALLLGGLTSVAQEKQQEKQGEKVEIIKIAPRIEILPKNTFRVVASKSAFSNVVKGAPYSATAVTEHTQTLIDGNQIIRKNESKLYRDSEGRTRTEQTLETIGKWTADGEAQQLTYIEDPVARFSYSLDPVSRTAFKGKSYLKSYRINYTRAAPIEGKKAEDVIIKHVGPVKDGKGTSRKAAVRVVVGPKIDHLPLQLKWEGKGGEKLINGVSEDGRRKTESLGKEVIEGVEVEHTRTTLTIPAGEIGNIQPIEVIDETWYSPELQVMIMTKSRDPRFGETTYRLTNINRSEPERSLFEVPSDYNVKENPGPPPIKKRRPPNE